MIGVILTSHGKMAQGMSDTAQIFFGSDIKQFGFLGLDNQDDIQLYKEKLYKLIKNVDDGDGVVVLTDVLGGTPCNTASALANDKIQVISGMNIPILLEILTQRNQICDDIPQLIISAKDGIVWINELIAGILT